MITEDKNNQKTYRHNKQLPLALNRAIRRGRYISGKQLVANLKQDMRLPKSGRTYRIYKGVTGALKSSRLHKASSAYETPAVITGEFRSSIDFRVEGNTRLIFGSGSENKAKKYAEYLEDGTYKMAARKPINRS
jgi:hypothetical protein